MLAVLAAIFFAAALLTDITKTVHGLISPGTFMLAGLLCLALAVMFPGWPPRGP